MRHHTEGREEVAGAHSSLQDIRSSDVTFEDVVLALLGPLVVLLVLNSHPLWRRLSNPFQCFCLCKLFVDEHRRVPILCHQPVSLLLQEELILRKVFHLDASFRSLGNNLLLLSHPSFFLLLEGQLPSLLILGHLRLLFLLLPLSFGLLLGHPAHLLLNFKPLPLLLICLLLLPQFHLHLDARLLFFLEKSLLFQALTLELCLKHDLLLLRLHVLGHVALLLIHFRALLLHRELLLLPLLLRLYLC
jgi:hypothetical protein